MATSYPLSPDTLPLYIQYKRLTVRSLAQLYIGFAEVSERSIRLYAEAAGMRPDRLPTLELVTARTGDSVKFTFGEGWLLSISSSEEHDIIVDVPKKLGIPLLIGYLVLGGAKLVLDVRNAHLDTQIKQIELKLKKTELGKTLSPQTTAALSDQAAHVVYQIIDNRDFSSFVVYDVDIMEFRSGRKQKRELEGSED